MKYVHSCLGPTKNRMNVKMSRFPRSVNALQCYSGKCGDYVHRYVCKCPQHQVSLCVLLQYPTGIIDNEYMNNKK